MAISVVEYVREDGSNPYKAWFDSLDRPAATKVATATLRLEMGATSNVRWIGGIGEYRIDRGPGYRIYLANYSENLIIIFPIYCPSCRPRHTMHASSFRSSNESRGTRWPRPSMCV